MLTLILIGWAAVVTLFLAWLVLRGVRTDGDARHRARVASDALWDDFERAEAWSRVRNAVDGAS